jgi:hypothetical protein
MWLLIGASLKRWPSKWYGIGQLNLSRPLVAAAIPSQCKRRKAGLTFSDVSASIIGLVKFTILVARRRPRSCEGHKSIVGFVKHRSLYRGICLAPIPPLDHS